MKILVGFDGSAASIAAVEDLSRAGLPERGEAVVVSVCELPLRGGASAHVDTVELPIGGPVPEPVGEAAAKQVRIDGATEVACRGAALLRRALPGWTAIPDAFAGSPATVFLDLARKESPDLLVVGAHGGSAFAGFLLGSVAMKLATAAPCAVRIGRPPAGRARVLHLLVAHDGGEAGDALVEAVASRHFPPGTRAKVVSVHEPLLQLGHAGFTHAALAGWVEEVDRQEHTRRLGAVRAAAERLTGARIETTFGVATGDPVRALGAEAREFAADVLFVGARGLNSFERVLVGSVSAGVALAAPCSVEILRGLAVREPSPERELAGV